MIPIFLLRSSISSWLMHIASINKFRDSMSYRKCRSADSRFFVTSSCFSSITILFLIEISPRVYQSTSYCGSSSRVSVSHAQGMSGDWFLGWSVITRTLFACWSPTPKALYMEDLNVWPWSTRDEGKTRWSSVRYLEMVLVCQRLLPPALLLGLSWNFSLYE